MLPLMAPMVVLVEKATRALMDACIPAVRGGPSHEHMCDVGYSVRKCTRACTQHLRYCPRSSVVGHPSWSLEVAILDLKKLQDAFKTTPLNLGEMHMQTEDMLAHWGARSKIAMRTAHLGWHEFAAPDSRIPTNDSSSTWSTAICRVSRAHATSASTCETGILVGKPGACGPVPSRGTPYGYKPFPTACLRPAPFNQSCPHGNQCGPAWAEYNGKFVMKSR